MFDVHIDEKYVDPKKHQMVTYIIRIEGIQQKKMFNFFDKTKKNIVGRLSPEKNIVFSRR